MLATAQSALNGDADCALPNGDALSASASGNSLIIVGTTMVVHCTLGEITTSDLKPSAAVNKLSKSHKNCFAELTPETIGTASVDETIKAMADTLNGFTLFAAVHCL